MNLFKSLSKKKQEKFEEVSMALENVISAFIFECLKNYKKYLNDVDIAEITEDIYAKYSLTILQSIYNFLVTMDKKMNIEFLTNHANHLLFNKFKKAYLPARFKTLFNKETLDYTVLIKEQLHMLCVPSAKIDFLVDSLYALYLSKIDLHYSVNTIKADQMPKILKSSIEFASKL
ncbi:MAG: hypothetical protein RSE00_01335 [Clostridia bacterium]